MPLNPLLLITAAVYLAAGVVLTFAGGEAIATLGGATGAIETWAVQLAGAGLVAIGWLNWVHRYTIVAGILGRPVLLVNLVFAATGTGASISAWRDSGSSVALAAAFVLGAVFVAFGLRLFRPPPPPAG